MDIRTVEERWTKGDSLCFFFISVWYPQSWYWEKTVLADPRADIRWEFITIVDPKLEEISLQSSEKVVSVDHITETVETMKLDSKFTCPDCKAQYQIEGKFKKHLADVHGNGKKDSICTYCEKVLSSTRALERHLKV